MKRKHSASVSDGADNILLKVEESIDEQPKKRQQTRRQLFVSSLPSNCTTQMLKDHFSEEFPIKAGLAVLHPGTNTCKGYGFITFTDAEDAQRALEKFQGSQIGSKKIKLDVADPRQRNADKTMRDGQAGQVKIDQSQSPKKLIVRNLPWSVKDQELKDLFRSYGKVREAFVPKKAGRQMGFGIVLLRGKKNMENAIEKLNGKEVDGRTLAVDWAVDKQVWQQQKESAALEEDNGEKDELAVANGADENVENADDNSSVVSEDSSIESDEIEDDDDANGAESTDERAEDDKKDSNASDQNPEEDYSAKLFIRNLPFEATNETLRDHFSKFGVVRYAAVVYDDGRSRGTGFVCFKSSQDATNCLKGAPKDRSQIDDKASRRSSTLGVKSVLQNEDSDPSGEYTMDGRVLQVSRAVDRQQAAKLTEANKDRRADQDRDKRRMYLLAEGVVPRKSALYQMLSPAEIAMRDASMKQRKSMLQSNPSLNLSLTRLSVRNIPRSVTSKDLKQLARQAVVGFAQDVKEGKRQRLSKEELERGGEAMLEAEQLRKKQGKGVVKQAKIEFESREGSKVTEKSGGGRSRSYGFIEYHTHRLALMGLRYLNGYPVEYTAMETSKGRKKDPEVGKKKRLIVEFAVDNAQVVNRRKDKESRARDSGGNREEKRSEETNKEKAPASQKSEEQEKQAKRQRIINKKRALRRQKRRGAGKA